jgi:hypothetical protein
MYGGSPAAGGFLGDVWALHLPSLAWAARRQQPRQQRQEGARGPPGGVPVAGRPAGPRRVAGYTLAGGLALGGCVPTLVGVVPVAKCDVLLLGPPPRLEGEEEEGAVPTLAQACASKPASLARRLRAAWSRAVAAAVRALRDGGGACLPGWHLPERCLHVLPGVSGWRLLGGLVRLGALPGRRGTVGTATKAFGSPARKRASYGTCHVTWSSLGAIMTFAPSGGSTCADTSTVRAAVLTGPQWVTAKGLKPGDRISRMRALYGKKTGVVLVKGRNGARLTARTGEGVVKALVVRVPKPR